MRSVCIESSTNIVKLMSTTVDNINCFHEFPKAKKILFHLVSQFLLNHILKSELIGKGLITPTIFSDNHKPAEINKAESNDEHPCQEELSLRDLRANFRVNRVNMQGVHLKTGHGSDQVTSTSKSIQ